MVYICVCVKLHLTLYGLIPQSITQQKIADNGASVDRPKHHDPVGRSGNSRRTW